MFVRPHLFRLFCNKDVAHSLCSLYRRLLPVWCSKHVRAYKRDVIKYSPLRSVNSTDALISLLAKQYKLMCDRTYAVYNAHVLCHALDTCEIFVALLSYEIRLQLGALFFYINNTMVKLQDESTVGRVILARIMLDHICTRKETIKHACDTLFDHHYKKELQENGTYAMTKELLYVQHL